MYLSLTAPLVNPTLRQKKRPKSKKTCDKVWSEKKKP